MQDVRSISRDAVLQKKKGYSSLKGNQSIAYRLRYIVGEAHEIQELAFYHFCKGQMGNGG